MAASRMESAGRQRIDKWLFFSRAVKSRSLAARLVLAGHVRLNRDKIEQPAQPVKQGDVLTIRLERRVLVWRVLLPGARRGPAEEARTLYEDLTPPAAKSGDDPAVPAPPLRDHGSGRPTKKERRQVDALRDVD